MRSWLFVPADSEKKLVRGRDCGADALVIDLEDSVVPPRRPEARRIAHHFLTQDRPTAIECWVRINPLGGEDALLDLAAVMPGRPDGILLPKCDPDDLRTVDHFLLALEAAAGLDRGSTRVLPIATETAAALFRLGGYSGAPRLAGLTWGAEDLAAAIGAGGNRRPDGVYDDVFRLARSLCILAASAAGVPAIDTVFTDFRNEDGLRAECAAARRAGFLGKLAIHPAQVAVINEAFTPSGAELEWARRVVAAFADNPDAGTIGLDGKMIDKPHLVAAQRVLRRA